MITYINDAEQMEISCDQGVCGYTDFYDGSWQECIDQAKDDGWKVRKVAGEWEHTCPDDAKEDDFTAYG